MPQITAEQMPVALGRKLLIVKADQLGANVLPIVPELRASGRGYTLSPRP